mmetsp:Transcript_79418/g.210856  ORF Transcript_79418/g.210856 Transcript_79418/m.210856 type:complete len:360 (+) Transcript_79418:974-2053(+)
MIVLLLREAACAALPRLADADDVIDKDAGDLARAEGDANLVPRLTRRNGPTVVVHVHARPRRLAAVALVHLARAAGAIGAGKHEVAAAGVKDNRKGLRRAPHHERAVVRTPDVVSLLTVHRLARQLHRKRRGGAHPAVQVQVQRRERQLHRALGRGLRRGLRHDLRGRAARGVRGRQTENGVEVRTALALLHQLGQLLLRSLLRLLGQLLLCCLLLRGFKRGKLAWLAAGSVLVAHEGEQGRGCQCDGDASTSAPLRFVAGARRLKLCLRLRRGLRGARRALGKALEVGVARQNLASGILLRGRRRPLSCRPRPSPGRKLGYRPQEDVGARAYRHGQDVDLELHHEGRGKGVSRRVGSI